MPPQRPDPQRVRAGGHHPGPEDARRRPHRGGPAGPLPKEYTEENLELLEKGCENLFHHVNTIKKSGIVPVVCINQFYTDTDAEIALTRDLV